MSVVVDDCEWPWAAGTMRLSLRKVLQVLGLCVCVVLVHVCYTLISQGGSVSRVSTVLATVQHGADSGTVHGSNNTTKTQVKGYVFPSGKNRYPDRTKELLKLSASKSILSTNGSRTPTELNDIYLSVKTTAKFHETRVDTLLKTWAGEAKAQVGQFQIY